MQLFEILIIVIALFLGIVIALLTGFLISKSRRQQATAVAEPNIVPINSEKEDEKTVQKISAPVSVKKEPPQKNIPVNSNLTSVKNENRPIAAKMAEGSNQASAVSRTQTSSASQGNQKPSKGDKRRNIPNKSVQSANIDSQVLNRKLAENSQPLVTENKKSEQITKEVMPPAKETAAPNVSVLKKSEPVAQEIKSPVKETATPDKSALMKEKTKQMLVDMVEKLTTEKVKSATEKVGKLQETIKQSTNQQSSGLAEIETNLKIAVTEWSGKPLQFETSIWDVNGNEFNFLSPEQHNELAQAYVDISLANQIVWVWNELGGASKDLQFSYKSLCFKIADRLAKIIQQNITP
ncbi:MAG TPA: hypothetical protein VEH58_07025 [Dehalococcoidales bacterium]|nr:hypothetical protein [Dehalococcoidales bacterium]